MKNRKRMYMWLMIALTIVFVIAEQIVIGIAVITFMDWADIYPLVILHDISDACCVIAVVTLIATFIFAKSKFNSKNANKAMAIVCAILAAIIIGTAAVPAVSFFTHSNIEVSKAYESPDAPLSFDATSGVNIFNHVDEANKYYPYYAYTKDDVKFAELKLEHMQDITNITTHGYHYHGVFYESKYSKSCSYIGNFFLYLTHSHEQFEEFEYQNDASEKQFINVNGEIVTVVKSNDDYCTIINHKFDTFSMSITHTSQLGNEFNVDDFAKTAVEQYKFMKQAAKNNTFFGVKV